MFTHKYFPSRHFPPRYFPERHRQFGGTTALFGHAAMGMTGVARPTSGLALQMFGQTKLSMTAKGRLGKRPRR